jgi:hypothetical protein
MIYAVLQIVKGECTEFATQNYCCLLSFCAECYYKVLLAERIHRDIRFLRGTTFKIGHETVFQHDNYASIYGELTKLTVEDTISRRS